MTELIGKRIDALDKGYIELLDMMPHSATSVSGDLFGAPVTESIFEKTKGTS